MRLHKIILNRHRRHYDIFGLRETKDILLYGNQSSSALRAIADCMSWYIARVKTERGRGNPITEWVSAAVEIHLGDTEKAYEWRLHGYRNRVVGCSKLAEFYRELYTHDENTNFPVIAWYPMDLFDFNVNLSKFCDGFTQLDAYNNALPVIKFDSLFEWIAYRQSIQSENIRNIYQNISCDEIIDSQLAVVRNTIEKISDSPRLNGLYIKHEYNRPRSISIDRNGKTVHITALSSLDLSLIFLFGDIARRLTLLNPALENPLLGTGIILIDQPEVHLDCEWQRLIFPKLLEIFPNCQFIIGSNSHDIISANPSKVFTIDE